MGAGKDNLVNSMLEIEVYLVPVGDFQNKQLLGTMQIANVGGSKITADYNVKLFSDDMAKATQIRGYKRSRGFWNLLKEALNAVDFNK